MSAVKFALFCTIPPAMFRKEDIVEVRTDVEPKIVEGRSRIEKVDDKFLVDDVFLLKEPTQEERKMGSSFWDRAKPLCILTGLVTQGAMIYLSYKLFRWSGSWWIRTAVAIAAFVMSTESFKSFKSRYEKAVFESSRWSFGPGVLFLKNRDIARQHIDPFTSEEIGLVKYLHPKEKEEKYQKHVRIFNDMKGQELASAKTVKQQRIWLDSFFNARFLNPLSAKVVEAVYGKIPEQLNQRVYEFERLRWLEWQSAQVEAKIIDFQALSQVEKRTKGTFILDGLDEFRFEHSRRKAVFDATRQFFQQTDSNSFLDKSVREFLPTQFLNQPNYLVIREYLLSKAPETGLESDLDRLNLPEFFKIG